VPGEVGNKYQWRAGCAEAHPGAVDTKSKRCEDCGLMRPSCGVWGAGGGYEEAVVRRLCKDHPGAVDSNTVMKAV
jgi:hypothetical protein